MSEFTPVVCGIARGFKDSLIGMTALFRLNSAVDEGERENHLKLAEHQESVRRANHRVRNEKKAARFSTSGLTDIYSKMLQCCLLNGGTFWMSIFLFENYIIPGLQKITSFIFNVLSGSASHQSLWLWLWMEPLLSYLFSMLWVLPLFWLSKPLNSLWYQEIANCAYRNTRGRPLGFLTTLGQESLSSYVSKSVADFFFTFFLQLFFLVQTMLVSFLPILGTVISLGHLCLLYSLYTFEYKWVNMGWTAPKRLSYVESNWPYFVGFGLPLAILTSLSPSFIISGCVFAMLFPVFIISGNEAEVQETNQVPVRIFSVVIWLTNKVFTRRPITNKPLDTSSDSLAM